MGAYCISKIQLFVDAKLDRKYRVISLFMISCFMPFFKFAFFSIIAGATDKTDTNYDGKNGIRSLCISPDGQHLASGDRIGNVRWVSLHGNMSSLACRLDSTGVNHGITLSSPLPWWRHSVIKLLQLWRCNCTCPLVVITDWLQWYVRPSYHPKPNHFCI